MADDGNGDLIKKLLPSLIEELRRGIVQDVVSGAREDIQSLLAATTRGPAPAPPPQIEWLRKDLISAVGDAVRKETSEFLPEEEIEGRIAKVTATIDRRLDGFEANFLEKVREVVRGEIDKFREELFEIFDNLELPLEKGEDKRKKTAERIRGDDRHRGRQQGVQERGVLSSRQGVRHVGFRRDRFRACDLRDKAREQSLTSAKSAAGYMAHAVMGMLMATALVLGWVFGQDAESDLYPVVVETAPPSDIYRDRDKACFTLHLLKVRDGDKPWYGYWAAAHLSPDMPLSLSPSNERHEKFAEDLVVHPVGKKWDRPFCFDMPGTVAENQELILHGHAEHRVHPFWKSASPLQSFKICGLTDGAPMLGARRKPDPFCERQRKGFDLS